MGTQLEQVSSQQAVAQPIIEITHLKKSFGANTVLKDINFSVHKGEVVSIIGSSGSGKSTLLRCINLLEQPSGGQIIYKGENILDHKHDLNKYRTNLGMVFQHFNLFNNLDVLKNCTVGQMKVLGRSKQEAEANAMKYLQLVGMERYIHAKPKHLSGGQKQRVAITELYVWTLMLCCLTSRLRRLTRNGWRSTKSYEKFSRKWFDNVNRYP